MNPNDPGRPINPPYLQNEHQGMGRRSLDGPLLHDRYHTRQLRQHASPEDLPARSNSPASTYPQMALDREPGFPGTTRYSESSQHAMQYQESDRPLGAYSYPQANADYGGEMDALHNDRLLIRGSQYPPPHASYPLITNTMHGSISMTVPHSDSTNLDTPFAEPNVASTSYHRLQQAQAHHAIQAAPHLRQSPGQGRLQSHSPLFSPAVEYPPSLVDLNIAPGQNSSHMRPQPTSYDARQALPMRSHLASYEALLPAPQARSVLHLQVGHDPTEIGSTTISARSHSTNVPTFGGYDTMHASSSIPMSNIVSAHNNNTTPLPTSSSAQLFPTSASNWPRHGYEYGPDGASSPLSDLALSSTRQSLGSGPTTRSFPSGSSVPTNLLAHDPLPGGHNSQSFHPSSSTRSLSSSHSPLGPPDSPGPISDTDTPLTPGRDEMGDHTGRDRVSQTPLGSSSIRVSDTGEKKGEDTNKAGKKKKKSKMHQCEICKKSFPRPSGLKTHMNTHSNAKPYHCYVPGCNRKFGVQSNAKRHLRTHGIVNHQPTPTSGFAGFSPHVILQDPNRQLGQQSDTHPSGSGDGGHSESSISTPLRWVPVSLASRTNASRLEPARERWHPSRGMGEDGMRTRDIDGMEDGDDDEDDEDAISRMSIPLRLTPASVPSDSQSQPPLPPSTSFPFTFTRSPPLSRPNPPTSSSPSIPTPSHDQSRRQLDPRAASHPYPSSQPKRYPES